MSESKRHANNLDRSCNEALILAVLADGPRHGYQLALEIEERSGGFFRFKHGTLYPILHKLEREGLLRGDWSEPAKTRKRKRYTLTARGRRELSGQRDAWRSFCRHFGDIVGELGR